MPLRERLHRRAGASRGTSRCGTPARIDPEQRELHAREARSPAALHGSTQPARDPRKPSMVLMRESSWHDERGFVEPGPSRKMLPKRSDRPPRRTKTMGGSHAKSTRPSRTSWRAPRRLDASKRATVDPRPFAAPPEDQSIDALAGSGSPRRGWHQTADDGATSANGAYAGGGSPHENLAEPYPRRSEVPRDLQHERGRPPRARRAHEAVAALTASRAPDEAPSGVGRGHRQRDLPQDRAAPREERNAARFEARFTTFALPEHASACRRRTGRTRR